MSNEKKVLIVDDEPDAIDIVKAMLSEIEGISVLSANDGNSGLEKAKEAKPDLIILDVQMPGKNGFEVYYELKKNESTKGIPVIMLTGIGDKTGIRFSSQDMEEFIGTPPEAYIEKPVDAETLQNTVSKIIGQ
ncbi:response regulator [Candidatus Latescibacterota bacterium]